MVVNAKKFLIMVFFMVSAVISASNALIFNVNFSQSMTELE